MPALLEAIADSIYKIESSFFFFNLSNVPFILVVKNSNSFSPALFFISHLTSHC
jgi:hypothetical protein